MVVEELVGLTGLVVGIERNGDVIALASERAHAAELPQITFKQTSVESFSSQETFDLVIGIYILAHQSDPVGFLRAAARLVSKGGSIAFHEILVLQMFDSAPPVPL